MTLNPKITHFLQHAMLMLLLCASLFAQSENGSAATAPSASPEKSAAPDKSPASEKGRSDDAYVIGANDVLAVNVWKEPDITRSVPVRSDGKISLPLAGELQAAGQTPRQLEQEITKRLQSYIS